MTALPLRDFTAAEQAKLAAIEAAPAAEESFDATAALRRVLTLADHWDTDEDARYNSVRIAKQTAARNIRRAVRGD